LVCEICKLRVALEQPEDSRWNVLVE
jgi:hypothetical protein